MVDLSNLTDTDYLKSIWRALQRIEQALAPLGEPVAPNVLVEPPDLGDIVTAVNGLQPGPSAEEIAQAIASVLRFPQPEPDANLARVADQLEKLSNQLKGLNRTGGGGGGGTVSLSQGAIDQITGPVANTSNVYAVPASTSVQTIGDAAAGRVAMTVLNEPGSARMFLKFGEGASAASYSNVLGPGDYWESMPPRFTGPVTAVWEAATGRALVTEFLT